MSLITLLEGDRSERSLRCSSAMSKAYRACNFLADASATLGDTTNAPTPDQPIEWALLQAGVWANRAATLLKEEADKS